MRKKERILIVIGLGWTFLHLLLWNLEYRYAEEYFYPYQLIYDAKIDETRMAIDFTDIRCYNLPEFLVYVGLPWLTYFSIKFVKRGKA